MENLAHRFDYHPPQTDEVKMNHEYVRSMIKNVALAMEDTIEDCRELSIAYTKLEEAMFWLNAAIARNQ